MRIREIERSSAVGRSTREVTAIAYVSNGISAAMVKAALVADGHAYSNVVIISSRRIQVTHPWVHQCAEFIEFSKVPSLRVLGQINTLGFYRRAVSAVKCYCKSAGLRDIYIAGSDNLVGNHLIRWAERNADVRLTVVAEGFLNYQDILPHHRAWWRWAVKPMASVIMGLRYEKPFSHISGSYEPRTDRVISYSSQGLKAPLEKTVVVPFPRVEPVVTADAGTVLILLTGIAQWMRSDDFAVFKNAFGEWVQGLNAAKILVKRHPNYPSGGIEWAVGDFEYFEDRRGVEALAAEIPAKTIIGFCTTALATLKLMRPDLECIDFGSEFYCEKAYHGDRSIIGVLEAGGVKIVNFNS